MEGNFPWPRRTFDGEKSSWRHKKTGADLIPPDRPPRPSVCVSHGKNFSAPRNHPAPGALEYYGYQNLKNRWADTLPVPRLADADPMVPDAWQTVAGLDLHEASPPAPFAISRLPCATVPPDRRAGVIWKEVGTAGLAPRSGATSFSIPCSPSGPEAPPGTCGPAEEFWRWRKLVI